MKETPNECNINDCYLCSRCMSDWLPAVAEHKRNFHIKKGQQIFTEGETVKGIFFLYSGTVKVHKRWDNEKEIITRFALSGDIIGHLGLGKKPLYPVSATALSLSTVCFIDLGFFNSTLKVNPELTYDLMHFFANELQKSQNLMRNLAHMSVKARIANTFIELENQFGQDEQSSIKFDLSKQDIASYSGTTYETLFKVINELSGLGLIKQVGKRINILNKTSLQQLIENDNL